MRTGLSISYVDDPDDRVRLVRAAGRLGPDSVECLFSAWEHLTAPRIVHLDAADLTIHDRATMERLERAFDHLERQKIVVRVVGIDPHHPAIAP